MKKIFKFGLSLLLACGVVGTALGVANKPAEVAKAADETTTRVYAVLKSDWDNRDNNENRMYLHTWTDGGPGTTWPGYEMKRVLGCYSNDQIKGYWSGLFYVDVKLNDNIILNNGNTGGKASNQSATFSKSQLVSAEGKHLAIWVDAWKVDADNRGVEFKDVPCNAKQAAEIFSATHLDVCNNYNLYPMMNDLFIEPSTGWEKTEKPEEGTRYDVDVTSKEFNGQTTFKLDTLLKEFARQYELHNAAGSNVFFTKEEDFTTIIIVVTLVSISAIGFVAFISKKRKTA